MFFITNTGQPVPKGVQMPTCYGPYASRDDAINALGSFNQPGMYRVYGPAESTGDEASIEPAKVTLGKASQK